MDVEETDVLQGSAASECVVVDLEQLGRDDDRLQLGAIFERAFAQHGEALGDEEIIEDRAPGEGVRVNFDDAGVQVHPCELAAVEERVVSDDGDAARDGGLREFVAVAERPPAQRG